MNGPGPASAQSNKEQVARTKHAPERDRSQESSDQIPESPIRQAGPTDPHTLSPANLIALQRTLGNRAVTRLVQRRLRVGAPHDQYEQDADAMADQMLRAPDREQATARHELQLSPTDRVQLEQSEEEEDEEEDVLQRKLEPGASSDISPIRRTTRIIQRMMTQGELIAKAGKPKGNILFYKMSGKYKKVIKELTEYDDYVSVPPFMRSPTGPGYVRGADEYLDGLRNAAQVYLAAHATGRRTTHIQTLMGQIGPERAALNKLAANYDRYKDLPGRAAITAASQATVPLPPLIPPSIPHPSPKAPVTAPPLPPLPSAPKVGGPPQTSITGPSTPKPLPPLPSAPKVGGPPQTPISAPMTTTPPPSTTSPSSGVGLSEQEYLDKMKTGKFKWLSKPAQSSATVSPGAGILNLPGKGFNKLSEAELAAIRAYTAADYKYINPALSNSEAYLKNTMNPSEGEVQSGWGPERLLELQNRLNTDTRALLMELAHEGLQHSEMAIKGLQKLPPWTGKLKRGERFTEQEYLDRYQRGKVMARPAFTSISKNAHTALTFASGAKHPQRGILLDMDVKFGRDMNELSVYYDPMSGGEGEVLALPGAEFTVKNADDPKAKTAGVLNVELEQTK